MSRNPPTNILITVGYYFLSKWRSRLQEDSPHTVAKQMRKQGIPLGMALMLLYSRAEQHTHLNPDQK